MKYPTEVYRVSSRPYQGLPKLDYPLHDRIVTVTSCGRLCIGRRKINLSRAFAGQDVGIREVAEKIWLVTFMHYDLGFFDHETGRVECAPNPFEAQVLPMSGIKRYPSNRNGPVLGWLPGPDSKSLVNRGIDEASGRATQPIPPGDTPRLSAMEFPSYAMACTRVHDCGLKQADRSQWTTSAMRSRRGDRHGVEVTRSASGELGFLSRPKADWLPEGNPIGVASLSFAICTRPVVATHGTIRGPASCAARQRSQSAQRPIVRMQGRIESPSRPPAPPLL
jgi:hypothetical protein